MAVSRRRLIVKQGRKPLHNHTIHLGKLPISPNKAALLCEASIHLGRLSLFIGSNGSNPGIRCFPCKETNRPPYLWRCWLRWYSEIEAGAGCYYPRTMDQNDDGKIGQRGIGKVLLSGGGEPLREMRIITRYAYTYGGRISIFVLISEPITTPCKPKGWFSFQQNDTLSYWRSRRSGVTFSSSRTT